MVAVAVRGEPPVIVTMGREVDPEGIFLIASITKTFTSTVILQLMEEGLLDLDDPIEALLPGVLEGESITVRHLLTHQSGLHSYTSADFRQDFTENPERRWLPLDVISPYLDRDRLSEPGEVYSYSNTNFIILGMVIEAVSGNHVSAAIRRRVLEPAAMERTYLAGAEEGPERVSSNSGEASNSRLSATWTAGAMASTASDLVAVRPRPVRGLPP